MSSAAGRVSVGLFFACLAIFPVVFGQSPIFSDDFNRVDNVTVGSGWVESGNPEMINITSNHLQLWSPSSGEPNVYHAVTASDFMNFSFYVNTSTRLGPQRMTLSNSGAGYDYSKGCGIDFTGDNPKTKVWWQRQGYTSYASCCDSCTTTNSVYHVNLVFNDTADRIWVYINSAAICNFETVYSGCNAVNILSFGSGTSGNNFRIDDVIVYNASNFGAIPITSDLDAFIKNLSNVRKTVLKEGEDFRVFANFSLSNGSKLLSGNCNVTLYNASPSGDVPLLLNASLSMYVSNQSSEYHQHGIKSFFSACSQGSWSASANESVNVSNIAPQLSVGTLLANVSSYNLSINPSVEYAHGSWKWLSSVVDDDLDVVKYVWRNASGIVLQSVSTRSPGVQSTPDALFVRAGTYNFSVWANDSFKDASFVSALFRVNDTGMPMCLGLGSKSAQNGSWVSFDVSCSDEYLYFFNLSCGNGFHKANSSIASQAWGFLDGSAWRSTANVSCSYEYCDGHTVKELPGIDVGVGKMGLDGVLNRAAVSVEGITLAPLGVEASVRVSKLKDRYSFCYDFSKAGVEEVVIPIPAGCFAAPNSPWQGHLLCPKEGLWWDFENKEGVKVEVSGGEVFLDYSAVPDKRNVCFNSVGKFNCVSGSLLVRNVPRVPGFWEPVGLSTGNSIFLVGMAFVSLALIAIAELSSALVFGFIAVFVILWVGFMFMAFWLAFSVLWLSLGVLYLFRTVYRVVAE